MEQASRHLLKILAGITDPTSGEARVRGGVGALLDVGTGMHPELTGRENVYLMGGVLGLRRAEVRSLYRRDGRVRWRRALHGHARQALFDRDAVAARLRVAAHIQPPIVVIDEILAVGDAAFRERSVNKMSELEGHGRTLLFVSHDLGMVARLCPRVLWIEDGTLRADGPATEVISSYLGARAEDALERRFEIEEGSRATITRVCDRKHSS